MSAVGAVSTPSTWSVPEVQHPHIEIVSTRAQRRARPRLMSAVITVAALFAILAAQLLLSIASSEGAYEIASLQTKHVELSRDQQILSEQLQVLTAPQHLASEAQSMGMVAASSAAHLRLADGVILGEPVPAGGVAPLRVMADGSPLIPDALLSTIALVGSTVPAAVTAAPLAPVIAGSATAATAEIPAVAVPAAMAPAGPVTAIPSPQTH
ncbi:MAG: hypothetical protein H7248_05270 [Microbacteriaceae bacterium]|nr:hypothetical protein [Microbacteriaceae bacterium]